MPPGCSGPSAPGARARGWSRSRRAARGGRGAAGGAGWRGRGGPLRRRHGRRRAGRDRRFDGAVSPPRQAAPVTGQGAGTSRCAGGGHPPVQCGRRVRRSRRTDTQTAQGGPGGGLARSVSQRRPGHPGAGVVTGADRAGRPAVAALRPPLAAERRQNRWPSRRSASRRPSAWSGCSPGRSSRRWRRWRRRSTRASGSASTNCWRRCATAPPAGAAWPECVGKRPRSWRRTRRGE